MRKYNGMCITEALETAKQRLAARLMRHTTEAEAKRINAMFSKEPSEVYSQLQCSSIPRADKPMPKMNSTGRAIGGLRHHTSAQWLIAPRADHHNFPQQDPGAIKAADPPKVGHKHEELDTTMF